MSVTTAYFLVAMVGILAIQANIPTTLAEVIVVDLEAYYFEGAPDGVTKQVLGVNGQFPGPTIRAKIDDILVVRVTNSIRDKDGVQYPTSIHWHGIEMFLNPWFDGPEAVTQCPIPYGQSMEYRFRLYQAGTYWYHSHHSWQYTDGFWGLLIIDNTPEVHAYDEELAIALNDWHHKPAKVLTDEYLRQEIVLPSPDTGLINGRGTYPCETAIDNGYECDPNSQSPSLFNIKPGKTYRIRIINTSALEAYHFSIDGHKMTAIEVDGVDTVPVGPVDTFRIWPAQRISVLVTMNGTELDSFWIRSFSPATQQEQLAVLNYEYRGLESNTRGRPLLGPGRKSGGGGTQGRRAKHDDVDWDQLVQDSKNGRLPKPHLFEDATTTGEYKFPKRFSREAAALQRQNDAEQHRQALQATRLPITEPVVDPVFLNDNLCRPKDSRGHESAPNYYDELVVLNVTSVQTNSTVGFEINGSPYHVHSPPVLIRMTKSLPLNSTSNPQYVPRLRRVIQVVINNRDMILPHPWHLHGHTFWLLGLGAQNAGDFVESRDNEKLNIHGPRRDTTFVNINTWTVIRFETDSPGAWLLHCHINWHPEVGLAAVFIEGEEELRELFRVPEETKRVCALSGIEI